MKKWLMLVVFSALLIGCNQEASPSCSEDTIEINGECLEMDENEYALMQALETLGTLESYTVSIQLSSDEESYNATLKITDEVHYYNEYNQETYLIRNNEKCEIVTLMFDHIERETVPCLSTANPYQFYYQMDYTWFSFQDTEYLLNDEHFSQFEDLLLKDLPSATLLEVISTLNHTELSTITLTFEQEAVEYTLSFLFTNIDSTEIVIPEGVSS